MRASPFRSRLALLIFPAAVLLAGPASGEQVRVMTAGGMAAAHLAPVPYFERSTGHTVVTDATSTGLGEVPLRAGCDEGNPWTYSRLPHVRPTPRTT